MKHFSAIGLLCGLKLMASPFYPRFWAVCCSNGGLATLHLFVLALERLLLFVLNENKLVRCWKSLTTWYIFDTPKWICWQLVTKLVILSRNSVYFLYLRLFLPFSYFFGSVDVLIQLSLQHLWLSRSLFSTGYQSCLSLSPSPAFLPSCLSCLSQPRPFWLPYSWKLWWLKSIGLL